MKQCTTVFVLFLLMIIGSAASAQDGYFVYVSPDAIGVNAFLAMGKSGIEAAGEKFGAEVATYESTTAASRTRSLFASRGWDCRNSLPMRCLIWLRSWR